EALLVLHEAYTELDMTELADDALRVLEYNEPDHPYFTGDYGKKSIWDRLWPWGDDD
ncbi:MAG: hypothetical protein HRU51_03190, partial [Xanthomonadales bacterium]|nr:hypothetical protein [Xanthomonadales bacterium]